MLWGGAVATLALWAVLTFGAKIASGWVHVPLAIGAILAAVAIMRQRPKDEAGTDGASHQRPA